MLGAIVGILVIAGIFLINSSEEDVDVDSFAKCLTENGMIMYGTEWCGYCKKQKELFGDSFEFVNYIDCDKEADICSVEGIRGYPTWKINGESYPGVKSFEMLESLSGC